MRPLYHNNSKEEEADENDSERAKPITYEGFPWDVPSIMLQTNSYKYYFLVFINIGQQRVWGFTLGTI